MAFTYELIINLGIVLLTAVGLMIIFGLMGIINMAHGEFIMLGAYVASYSTSHFHVPFIVSVFAAFIVVAAFGIVIERLLIRWLYNDIIMGLVATWGLSLFISGMVLVMWGPSMGFVPIPIDGHVNAGDLSYGTYPLFICGVAVVLLVALHQLLQRSQWGIELRATIYDRKMAAAMGIRTDFINITGFALGAGLGGVAGALLAPLSALTPTMGATYLPIAFITVVVAGGTHIVGSLLAASIILGIAFTYGIHSSNALIGLFFMLGTALVIIRIAPNGLAEKFVDFRSMAKKFAKLP